MDDPNAPEPALTRTAHWFRATPAEVVGLAVLLTGALAASVALWWAASGRPTALPNDAARVGEVVGDAPADHAVSEGFAAGDGSATGTSEPGAAAAPSGSPAGAHGPAGMSGPPGSAGDHATDPAAASPMTVHVTGAVATPGVVVVPAGARVGDAVEAAGGLAAEAAPELINLARPLADGEHVHVPRPGEEPFAVPPPPASSGDAPGSGRPGTTTPDGRVNLNLASQEELETLPGIGPAKASSIIEYREANGPFATPGDIRNVSGIGEATFQRLADLVSVE